MLKIKHLSVLLLLIGFYSSADAAVLCSNLSGSVFVRADVCRAGETKLDPVALGLKGPAGTPGADGADGVSGWEIKTHTEELPAQGATGFVVTCPEGKKPVGGGFSFQASQVLVLRSRPVDDGWDISIFNGSTSTVQISGYAVCVTALAQLL